MDIYFKTIGIALIALFLCLVLSNAGKDYALLLGVLACCLAAAAAMRYLEPVVHFFHSLEELIPLDQNLLTVLVKTVGVGIVGELAAMICVDAGNSALGKAVQFMSSIMILWLALPLLQSLLDLVQEILEAV